MLKYSELNDLFLSKIKGMKEAHNDLCDNNGECDPDWLCACELVPNIIMYLEEGNDEALKPIFEVIEQIYAYGDRDCLYLANVSIAEQLYNSAYDDYADKIISLAGPASKKIFTAMLD